jgi:hypothetical protein
MMGSTTAAVSKPQAITHARVVDDGVRAGDLPDRRKCAQSLILATSRQPT